MMGWQWHQLNHMQAICTSLQKITTPAPHQSDFYRPDALPDTQPTASKHLRHNYHYQSKWIMRSEILFMWALIRSQFFIVATMYVRVSQVCGSECVCLFVTGACRLTAGELWVPQMTELSRYTSDHLQCLTMKKILTLLFIAWAYWKRQSQKLNFTFFH